MLSISVSFAASVPRSAALQPCQPDGGPSPISNSASYSVVQLGALQDKVGPDRDLA